MVRSALDRSEHQRVVDRRRIAFALQPELLVVDADGDVGREDELEVDGFRARIGRGKEGHGDGERGH